MASSNGAPQLEDAKLLHLVALLCVMQVFYIVSCIILQVLLLRVGGNLPDLPPGAKLFRSAQNFARYIFPLVRQVCVPPRRFRKTALLYISLMPD